jgi:hypothetical protein
MSTQPLLFSLTQCRRENMLKGSKKFDLLVHRAQYCCGHNDFFDLATCESSKASSDAVAPSHSSSPDAASSFTPSYAGGGKAASGKNPASFWSVDDVQAFGEDSVPTRHSTMLRNGIFSNWSLIILYNLMRLQTCFLHHSQSGEYSAK